MEKLRGTLIGDRRGKERCTSAASPLHLVLDYHERFGATWRLPVDDLTRVNTSQASCYKYIITPTPLNSLRPFGALPRSQTQVLFFFSLCNPLDKMATTTEIQTLSTEHGIQTDTAQQDKRTPLQLISQGACLPGIPRHPTFAAQRQWLLEQMALAFRVFSRKGYTDGMAGHISVRDPENPHTFWTVSEAWPSEGSLETEGAHSPLRCRTL